jgi:hypothetical protein
MNLKDLSQIDVNELKNLNYNKIVEELKKQPLVLIGVAVSIGTLIFCVQFYSKSQRETIVARAEIPKLESKIATINEYEKLQQELKNFFNETKTPLTGEELMSQITDFASKYDIQIESLSPTKEQDETLFHITSINLSISGQNYRDIILFLYDIEHHLSSIRILKYSTRLEGENQAGGRKSIVTHNEVGAKTGKTFKINMEIASVAIKKNEN